MDGLLLLNAPFAWWLLGTAALGGYTATRSPRLNPPNIGCVLVSTGAGGLMGLSLPLLIIKILPINLASLQYVYVTVMMAMLLAATQFLLKRRRSGAHPLCTPFANGFGRRKAVQWPLITLLASIVFFNLLSMYLFLSARPVEAWDFLSFWGGRVITLHEGIKLEDLGYILAPHRHPDALPYLAALSLVEVDSSTHMQIFYLAWFAVWISAILLIAGFSLFWMPSPALALLSVLSLQGMPLLVNHVSLVGYTEFLVSVAVLAAVCLISMGIATRKKTVMCCGLFFCLLPIFIRNTGFGYSLIIIMAYFSSLAIYYAPKSAMVGILGSIAAITLIPSIERNLDLLNSFILFDHSVGDLVVAGKRLDFIEPLFFEVSRNLFYAFVLNGSFQILIIIIFLATYAAFFFKRHEVLFVANVCLNLFLALSLAQLTDYGFEYATPDNDTGFSRFSLPLFIIAPACIPILVAYASRLGLVRM